jgi:hypothetical protein
MNLVDELKIIADLAVLVVRVGWFKVSTGKSPSPLGSYKQRIHGEVHDIEVKKMV